MRRASVRNKAKSSAAVWRAGLMVGANVYAICLRSRPGRLDGVLMLLDEKDEADAIAFELRRKGHDVDVREYLVPDDPPEDELE